jgi:hypothetical protein
MSGIAALANCYLCGCVRGRGAPASSQLLRRGMIIHTVNDYHPRYENAPSLGRRGAARAAPGCCCTRVARWNGWRQTCWPHPGGGCCEEECPPCATGHGRLRTRQPLDVALAVHIAEVEAGWRNSSGSYSHETGQYDRPRIEGRRSPASQCLRKTLHARYLGEFAREFRKSLYVSIPIAFVD